ncbi:MAG: membrane protein insertase YidC [Leptospiraceae bacterium]|nr:membrane protein insertase YidC [Leptospiraceae bacterium]
MENSNANKSASSFMPVLLVGLLFILGIQLFLSPDDDKKKPEGPVPEQEAPGSEPLLTPAHLRDFQFPRAGAFDKDIRIDTGKHLVILSPRGGRIKSFYVKSDGSLLLPRNVTAVSQDEIERDLNAIEITRHNGMDFQPHLYFSGDGAAQLGMPSLNDARFELERVDKTADGEFTEIRFRLAPLMFENHRLELRKIYRFIKGENYFRQITVLRNLEKKEFKLSCPNTRGVCDLYFKPFGDLGPPPGKELDQRTLSSYGRFFYYGDELITRSSKPAGKKGGACSFLPFGCSDPDDDGQYTLAYNNIPNGLRFAGSSSRYFIAYTDFMDEHSTPLHQPDGVVYRNTNDLDGRRAWTVAFHRFRLNPNKGGELELGSLANLEPGGKLQSAENSNQMIIQKSQHEHEDALIINNKVYVGIRTSASHSFQQPAVMAAEFGTSEPNSDAHNAIYSNRFYAFFSPIQAVIVKIMHWLYGVVGNYGWSIIIIAVSFKLLTFPLNQMQAKSMKKMQNLKPQIERLNEQYADNATEKQSKLMELYRKEGVNPAKGCLPILIQMPVFFALYSAFSESIELWGSPFILWITDLSKPDTLMVLPIMGGFNLNLLPLLMVVSQILQQHFTQMTVDPQQRMMMYMMPVMMLFFFWQFPSGVTLYWIVQNVLAIVWQFVVNKNLDKEQAVASAVVSAQKPAARSRKKKAK